MPERARTDPWEPQGSNPLGPPGPELGRVSTDEQSLDLQLDALKKAGCKRVFTDKADLQGRRVQFRSPTDGIDTTTPAGRFFFHVMASLAQMERELLAERTRAGLAAAAWP